ncbi:hypothetical protein A3H80_04885 [Candidatus Roizmanbacteria bacterium RIFCSPLOWO2_02_FULL_37_19]|uniref:NAD-dependent epimerase/dehydratase domain-containing protein n=1 Tax=Candidatus Roizmanbacteria bacterium RIFCSPHIGHO2_02_FULL_37_24 TaxID=1802037 RepID=A0A1F7GW99_9BACT|nr:MAG: hypothetical protein A2862_02095 [Candidatus Roizmanbacteria bacterium RIFCSPHIGHO2_01_FULL_38_41]OGK23191.1 MAG: hypothetical protein A3C24_00850 [Candidatus Roizmanbacteria bacterium RIFCSPHIGHO2_02_FULL_37_24]OGK32465.1 MAG: hypothetical protein A3E10_01260 [Candidatus Roizmanbacteria bacterium RIFCSPHIGHO2_12_FULL_37_23]OGK43604.1 MAG: hypothetical protein A2956_04195 [Candidatus Roizmanbacteria bacterium RIFCSPLOWO2_01_FULL_37_57]OGK54814.1 MAG: hypothetical protein A3H80_04885 [Ca
MKGPIAIFGSGGFVGSHLAKYLLKQRKDIIAFSHDPQKAWRLKEMCIPSKNISRCDLTNLKQVTFVLKKYQPKTIFNLAAYGAYSWEQDIEKIYDVNFTSTVNLIETLKKASFSLYVHAGSQSEYGLNAAGPTEKGELIPNSHYAVSKTGVSHLITFYGKVMKLPVIHLRLYSVYGPLEEKGRLVPTLMSSVKKGALPPFVDSKISRDFIYIDDVIDAFLTVTEKVKKKHYGETFNIATGKKTTMEELAYLAKKLFNITSSPRFNSIQKRDWDVTDWYGNPAKMKREFGWKSQVSLKEGLLKTFSNTEG